MRHWSVPRQLCRLPVGNTGSRISPSSPLRSSSFLTSFLGRKRGRALAGTPTGSSCKAIAITARNAFLQQRSTVLPRHTLPKRRMISTSSSFSSSAPVSATGQPQPTTFWYRMVLPPPVRRRMGKIASTERSATAKTRTTTTTARTTSSSTRARGSRAKTWRNMFLGWIALWGSTEAAFYCYFQLARSAKLQARAVVEGECLGTVRACVRACSRIISQCRIVLRCGICCVERVG